MKEPMRKQGCTVYLKEDVIKKLAWMARQECRSFSQLVGMIIDNFLRDYNEEVNDGKI